MILQSVLELEAIEGILVEFFFVNLNLFQEKRYITTNFLVSLFSDLFMGSQCESSTLEDISKR